MLALDFGDAPDTDPGTGPGNYNTLAANDGPSHFFESSGFELRLGSSVDEDDGTLQNAAATADDLNDGPPNNIAADDENGLSGAAGELTVTVGTRPTLSFIVTNTSGNTATLWGWIDYNHNGIFELTERGEATVGDQTLAGTVQITFPGVPSTHTGITYARFRLSTDVAAAVPTGPALDGEVEDYTLRIIRPALGVARDETLKITELLHELDGGDSFGSGVATIGDLDANGVPDVVVGAFADDTGGTGVNANRGAVYVQLMNSGGTANVTQKIADGIGNGPALADGDHFGRAVSSLGDLDGDGVPDMAVGAFGDDTGGLDPHTNRGAVHVLFMNGDGTVKSSVKIADGESGGPALQDGDKFGVSLSAVGDLDGDGLTELAVGAVGDDTGGPNRGAVHVLFLASDGTVKSMQKIAHNLNGGPTLSDNDFFGNAIAALGDLSGDGVPDLAVGAYRDDTNGPDRGAVHVLFMDRDGTVGTNGKIAYGVGGGPPLANGDYFGSSLSSLGDLDGDGVADLAVGAFGDDTGAFAADANRGALHVLFLNTVGSVKGTAKITHGVGGGPTLRYGDNFGVAVSSLGDLDGDGLSELVVGAMGDDTGGYNRGAVHVLFLAADGTVKVLPDPPPFRKRTKISHGTGDAFGSSVSSLGDLDGDGISDLAVGAPRDDTGGTDRGAVHVLFMNRDGTSGRTQKIAHGIGNGPLLANGDQFGISVSSLGDLDDDGIPELAVGAPGDDTGGSASGAVYVLFLNSDGTVKSSTKIAEGEGGGPTLVDADYFGVSVSAFGDLDGDGITELAVGATGDDTGGSNRGAVHVLFLGDDGMVKIIPESGARKRTKIADGLGGGPSLADGDLFGSAVGALGDLNGDGVADLAIGAMDDDTGAPVGPYSYLASRGAAYVLFMNADGTAESTQKIAHSLGGGPLLANGDHFGSSLGSLGDLDGDDVPELAVGAIGDDTGGQDRGAVHVLFLNANGTVKSTGKIAHRLGGGPSLRNYDHFGSAVGSLGDLDGDGFPELAVGAAGDDSGGRDRGAVYVLFLDSLGFVQRRPGTTKIAHQLNGGPQLADLDFFGRAVASLGDLDGDGVPEMVVGAYGDDTGGSNRGAVHVLFMDADGRVKTEPEKQKIAHNTGGGPSLIDGDYFGSSITSLGDLDGDGVPDMAVGAWGDDSRGTNRGAVHVLFMKADGTAKRTVRVDDTTSFGPQLSDFDYFGISVASLGDLDGDGLPEIAVGAIGDDTGAEYGGNVNRGAVHVLFMNANGSLKRLPAAKKIAHDSEAGPDLFNFDYFGSSVGSLGDLDGDGVPDMAVGAYGDDTGGNYRGAAYVLFMNRDGTVKAGRKIAHRFNGGPALANLDSFGSAVTGLGDLDGDGIPDLAVGAYGDSRFGYYRGAIHILLMNSTGTVKSSTKIDQNSGGGPLLADYDGFGRSIALLGDLDGDGIPELAVGAPGDDHPPGDPPGDRRGAVHILYLSHAPPTLKGEQLNLVRNTNRTEVLQFSLQFDQAVDVCRFCGAPALRVVNQTTGTTVDVSSVYLQRDDALLTWSLLGANITDGFYTAEITGLSVVSTNRFGRAVRLDTHAILFHVLAGDGNGDAKVDFSDFSILAANFGMTVGPFGPGDFNGDGEVNFIDFGILAGNFGTVLTPPEIDFGDAPGDRAFPVTLAEDGARHVLQSQMFLGPGVESDVDGQPHPEAMADDLDDGVVFVTPLEPNRFTDLVVTAAAASVLNAWIDFNADGDWVDAGEQIVINQALIAGANNVEFWVSASAALGPTTARFRVSSTAGHSFHGLAVDGEVEDYQVEITAIPLSSSLRAAAPRAAQLWEAQLVDRLGDKHPQTKVEVRRPHELRRQRSELREESIHLWSPTDVHQAIIAPDTRQLRPHRIASPAESPLDKYWVDQVWGQATELSTLWSSV